ncbi:MAG: hypothetical protein U5R14_11500 [Gemmatimonadota bacterium]|nr:hypothetical protein [Gemmatimonadota bacterium]
MSNHTLRSGFILLCIGLWPTWLAGQSQIPETCEWFLEETQRFGAADGEDALTGILDLEVGPDGNVFLAQRFGAGVTILTPDGETTVLGRAGRGPGEFDGPPLRLGFIGDTLWASDRLTVHFFGPDGAELRQVSFRTATGHGSRFVPRVPLADGSFLGDRQIDPSSMREFVEATRLPLHRFSASGEVLDPVTLIRAPPVVTIEGGGFTFHPLGDWLGESMLPVAVEPDGRAVVTAGTTQNAAADAFFLTRVDITGDTILHRSIPYEPAPVNASDREWLTEAFAGSLAGDHDPAVSRTRDDAARERQRRAAREAITFPDYFPPVRQVVPGADGSIWLLRELELPQRTDRWEVYGATGDLEGVVRVTEGRAFQDPWKPRLKMLWASRDQVWASSLGELDVPYLHRFRVVRGCD